MCTESKRDEYESQDDDQENEPSAKPRVRVFKRRVLPRKQYDETNDHSRTGPLVPYIKPIIKKRHFWRQSNDDDNETYPELRRPPRKASADIDQTEGGDVPHLNSKEAEDFDRLVVEAKKEKAEKEKKEKEEKEKKEKEEKTKKKDDGKKSIFGLFSQNKHHKKHHKHHHKNSQHKLPYHHRAYV